MSVQKTVTIPENQAVFVREYKISLSRVLQAALCDLQQKIEGKQTPECVNPPKKMEGD